MYSFALTQQFNWLLRAVAVVPSFSSASAFVRHLARKVLA
jgi:hypothetical protein